MIDSLMRNLIENHAIAFATVSNGRPHCVAVAYAKVFDDKILITDNFLVETVKNLNENPNVALTVWNENWQKDCCGFEFLGVAEYFKSGRWFDEIKKIPENKGMACKGAILVTVIKVKRLA